MNDRYRRILVIIPTSDMRFRTFPCWIPTIPEAEVNIIGGDLIDVSAVSSYPFGLEDDDEKGQAE